MRRRSLIAGGAALAAGWGAWRHGRSVWYPWVVAARGPRSVADVQREFGPEARARLGARFQAAGVPFPPTRVALIAFKEERQVELWTDGSRRAKVAIYPILAASGGPGPKLRQGDLQVPEGVYRLTGLNPNSSYHLSIRVDYPSADDQARAREDGRTNLGGDIFIHGRDVSIGCIALGDPAIEELFVLVADLGLASSRAIIAPRDPGGGRLAVPAEAPRWLAARYREIEAALAAFPR